MLSQRPRLMLLSCMELMDMLDMLDTHMPLVDAEPEADALYGYYGYRPYGYGYRAYGYGYPRFGYYGKRSAGAEPKAEADADAYYYGGYAYGAYSYGAYPYGYGYAWGK